MSIIGYFTSSHSHSRSELREREQAANDKLDDATREVLHVAQRVANSGKQDIFSELWDGLERRRHARTFPH